jgi:hypothetical protein
VSVLVVLAAAATVVPMVVTQAHENHFFLGGLFLLILALLTRSRRFLWGVQSLLLLMFINLFALYGFDVTVYRSPVRSLYTTPVQILVAAAATLMFAYGSWRAWNDEGFPGEVPERSASVPVAT